jgi:N utilization substance protein B
MNRRRAARLGAIQALYQAEVSGQTIEQVTTEFEVHRLADLLEPLELEGQPLEVDRDWFLSVAKGTSIVVTDLDQKIEKTLSAGWSLARLGYLLRAFLRAGAFELFHRPDVPTKAVINEYLELAHAFLEKDDVGFLNGVLDRLAAEARPAAAGPSEQTVSGDA